MLDTPSRETYYRALFPHVLRQCGRFKPDDPYERCGILLYGRTGLTFRELPNHHPDPKQRFRILSADVQGILRKRPHKPLWGYLHTHPGRTKGGFNPSSHDRSSATDMDKLHCVYHPASRTLSIYNCTGTYMRLRPKGTL